MALLKSGRLSVGASALVLVVLSAGAARAQLHETGENAVKAAFLYNFTKFVSWPAAAFEDPAMPFNVCVVADPVLRRSVEGMLAGESVGRRPLKLMTPDVRSVRRCHLAYFGRDASDSVAKMLALLKQAPVLTVGEGERFLSLGGHIAFVVENNRVRFDVNKDAIDRTGLTISSKLLRVARSVKTGGEQKPLK
jgi:hypothetical protein